MAADEIIIEPGKAEQRYWRDVWQYRELFMFLAWRDILVRYKQTIVGVAWALLRPVLTIAVFSIIYGHLAGLPSPGGIPYPLLVCCGMLPWNFFAAALSESGGSLVANAGMVSKVYFPRIVVPASSVITSLVDFAISFAILCVLLLWYGYVPGAGVLLLPVFVAAAFLAAFGVGLWTSALMVRYRDVRFILPFVAQFGGLVSPVGFTSAVVPEQWRALYSLNPMVGVIDGFRWAILGGDHAIHWAGFWLSLSVVSFITVTGFFYFRKTERTFADVI